MTHTATTRQPPLLMSLSGVAELAAVRRPVASMWRSRFREADVPFPAAVTHRAGQDLFDAAEVAAWLVETGHGNNPDAVEDAAAAADAVSIDYSDPAQTAALAALITLRAATGITLADAGRDLIRLAETADPNDMYLAAEIAAAGDRARRWAPYVDELVDASYTPAAALARVHERRAAAARAAASAGPPRPELRELLAHLSSALVDADRPRIAVGAGLDPGVLRDLIATLGDDLEVVWPDGDAGRMLRRVAVCEGLPLLDTSTSAESGLRTVVLDRFPRRAGEPAAQILQEIDGLAVGLDREDAAVVVAPARVLTDTLAGAEASARAHLLRTGRVHGIVRLDAGLVTAAAREALAVWVFGPEVPAPLADRVIAVADLTGDALTPARIADLVTDLAAALEGPALARAHRFRFARLQRTSSVLARQAALTADASRPASLASPAGRDLPALLDEARARAGDDAPALWVQAGEAAPVRTIRLDEAIAAGHARVISGVRIGDDEIGDEGLRVVTAADLDGAVDLVSSPVTARIDQLAFAQAHPNAQLTRPGDIVFRTSPTARAWLDREGSHVVATPARVLRITAADPGGLVPELVVADIARGASGPAAWKRWRLRTVAPDQIAPLRSALAESEASRRALRERIDALMRLEQILADAVFTHAITLTEPPAR